MEYIRNIEITNSKIMATSNISSKKWPFLEVLITFLPNSVTILEEKSVYY